MSKAKTRPSSAAKPVSSAPASSPPSPPVPPTPEQIQRLRAYRDAGLSLQRLALFFSEMGQSQIGATVLRMAVKVSRTAPVVG